MTATRVSAVTAYTAHREWASRPPDERYASVHALYDAARARHARIEERTNEAVDLRTECGHVSVTKGGRIRYLPLTRRLAGALKSARHLRGPRVLCDETGKPLTRKMIQVLMRRCARRANVKAGVHILRHTFCSHLAMRGAPARAIQELAGHQDLGTTQRYVHLSRD